MTFLYFSRLTYHEGELLWAGKQLKIVLPCDSRKATKVAHQLIERHRPRQNVYIRRRKDVIFTPFDSSKRRKVVSSSYFFIDNGIFDQSLHTKISMIKFSISCLVSV